LIVASGPSGQLGMTLTYLIVISFNVPGCSIATNNANLAITYTLGEPPKIISLSTFLILGGGSCLTTLGYVTYNLEDRITIWDPSLITVNSNYGPDTLFLTVDSVDSTKCGSH
jgi:hypothetical protein